MFKKSFKLSFEDVKKIYTSSHRFYRFVSIETKKVSDFYIKYKCIVERLSDNKYLEFDFEVTKILFNLKEEKSYTLREI